MSQNVSGKKERYHFKGQWWWRPVREDKNAPVTLAVVDAGQLRVIRGGVYEKWLPAGEDKGK